LTTRDPSRRAFLGGGGGFGLGGPMPRDLIVLLAVVFVTFSLRYFPSTAPIPAFFEISRAAWSGLEVWRLLTYPFIGIGAAGFWFIIGLVILYMFGRDAFYGLGRKHFWRLTLWSAVGAALVAVLTDIVARNALGSPYPFALMQGQTILATIYVAAFATAKADATILLFFIIPLKARWFLALEILFAFMGFLNTKDLPGFLGICAAVGLTYLYVRAGGSWGTGKRTLREARLRIERWWLQRKLDRNRKKRGFRVISGEGKKGDNGEVRKGPWVH
jgi:hypothetical protein